MTSTEADTVCRGAPEFAAYYFRQPYDRGAFRSNQRTISGATEHRHLEVPVIEGTYFNTGCMESRATTTPYNPSDLGVGHDVEICP